MGKLVQVNNIFFHGFITFQSKNYDHRIKQFNSYILDNELKVYLNRRSWTLSVHNNIARFICHTKIAKEVIKKIEKRLDVKIKSSTAKATNVQASAQIDNCTQKDFLNKLLPLYIERFDIESINVAEESNEATTNTYTPLQFCKHILTQPGFFCVYLVIEFANKLGKAKVQFNQTKKTVCLTFIWNKFCPTTGGLVALTNKLVKKHDDGV